jgi:hypothetical protein
MFTGHARYARPLLREESLLDAAQEERPVISSARLGAGPGTSPSEETTTSEQESLQLVGRSELLDRAVNLVEVGGNVLLFGADGCGRTAFLHEVVRRLATEKRVTRLIDGSGVDEPQRLVGHIVRACGLTVPSDLDVPSMLGCLPPPAAEHRVIAIDDLEISVGQELFGRWHRHLWRLGAQWVVVGGGDDPTPYLDAGADEWWEDGILPVPALTSTEARELVLRRLQAAGVACPCPDQLIAAARGNPRDLIRRVRSLLLSEMASRAEAAPPSAAGGGWVGRTDGLLADELSADETRMVGVLRACGSFSLADRTVIDELGWAYGKTHRIANELVRRGVLHRAGAPGDVGRPRVIYSLTAATGSGRTGGG